MGNLRAPTSSKLNHEPTSDIFAEYAPQYFDRNISVIPTGGEDGKRPREQGYMRYAKEIAGPKTQDRWLAKHPNANIGILAGPVSNLTIVDIDDPELLETAVERFGETPVKTKSPSGGAHLYYRYNGEKSLNRLDGRPIDIRAAGGTPLLIAPPSMHLKSGKPYSFSEGNIDELDNLPTATPGSLPLVGSISADYDLSVSGMVPEGMRTDKLFAELRKIVHECETPEELQFKAEGLNEALMDPLLSEADVERQVNGVWKLKLENRVFLPGDRFGVISQEEAKELYEYKPGLALLIHLRSHHPAHHEFFISSDGLSAPLKMSPNTVRMAREFLVKLGYLELVEMGKKQRQKDGTVKSTPNIYRLSPALKY